MYCSKCGEQNPDDAKFCSGCGSQLGTGVVVSEEPPTYYAGFWRRFVAAVIDDIIIISFIFGFMMALLGTQRISIALIITCVLGIVLNWLYFTLFESSSKQATFGKMALGIIVTDLSGNRISFGRANVRYWGKIVSGIILQIGYIMAGFTQKKQALHDIMAGTLVVKK